MSFTCWRVKYKWLRDQFFNLNKRRKKKSPVKFPRVQNEFATMIPVFGVFGHEESIADVQIRQFTRSHPPRLHVEAELVRIA